MKQFSRRSLLAGLAATDVASRSEVVKSSATLAAGSVKGEPAGPNKPNPSPTARQVAAEKLLAYFHGVAPRLLRPAQGILRHPSISPSLPGKAYSTQLWDWDTLWTSIGLFRSAQLAGDRDLLKNIGRHVRGRLLNFFDHQAKDGRIAIMIDVANPDPLRCHVLI